MAQAKTTPIKPKILSAGIVPIRLGTAGARFLLLRAYRYWDFPKGVAHRDEDPLLCAIRELKEETTIEKITFPFGHEFIETEPYSRGKVARYYVGITEQEEIQLLPNPESGAIEHMESRWLSYSEARELLVPRVQAVLDWAEEKALAPPRFLVDENLAGMTRWLRFFGYDALVAKGWSDREVMKLAQDENRVLITRDRDLARDYESNGVLIHVTTDDVQMQIRSVVQKFHPNPRRWFSRCAECNFPLKLLDMSEIDREARIPVFVKESGNSEIGKAWFCEGCSRVYWKGSHYDRTRATLQHLTEKSEGQRPSDSNLGLT